MNREKLFEHLNAMDWTMFLVVLLFVIFFFVGMLMYILFLAVPSDVKIDLIENTLVPAYGDLRPAVKIHTTSPVISQLKFELTSTNYSYSYTTKDNVYEYEKTFYLPVSNVQEQYTLKVIPLEAPQFSSMKKFVTKK